MSYLVAMDMGNTNLVLGLYQGPQLLRSYRLHTDRQRTVDEYGFLIKYLLADQEVSPDQVIGVCISNVVPGLAARLEEAVTRYLRRKPLFIHAFLDLGLKLHIDHPRQLGADLIAAAVATRERYGVPAVMIDFGTATTVAALDGQGAFVGASIAPGLEISLEAIRRRAPHLPDFPLDPPPGPLGRNTVHCLQSGVLLGHALMVDGLVRLIQAEVGPGAVVATGGLAEVVARHCSTVHSVDANLVLDGIRLVWERNAS